MNHPSHSHRHPGMHRVTSRLTTRYSRVAKPLCLIALMATIATAASVRAADIEYLFFELRPAMYMANNEPQGFVARRALQAFSHAGLSVDLVPELPFRRILTLLKDPIANRCSAGWFKTEERQQQYRYSLPIFQDPAQLILTTQNKKAVIAQHVTLLSLLQDPALTMGSINGLSNGQTFDELFIRLQTKRYFVQNYEQVFRMLASGRIDYLLADPFDVANLSMHQGLAIENFATVNYADTPKGEQRYIVCTQSTLPLTMEKINSAIVKLQAQDWPTETGAGHSER